MAWAAAEKILKKILLGRGDDQDSPSHLVPFDHPRVLLAWDHSVAAPCRRIVNTSSPLRISHPVPAYFPPSFISPGRRSMMRHPPEEFS